MPITIDHDQHVQPCLVAPAENGCVEDAGVKDAFVSLPPGLQNIRLSQQAAIEIKNVLDNASHPTYAGQEMPTADAATLLKKIR